MLHFSNNLEYYIKTRAIQEISNEMEARLKDIAANSGEATTATDMEDLIEIHEDYIKKIMRMCFLESKYKTVHELIEKIL
jgi:hypothetical protein